MYGQNPSGNYKRFQKPAEGEVYPSEYDFSSGLINDLQQRDLAPIIVQTFNLATASPAGGIKLAMPGRAFVGYGYTTTDTFKSPQNFRIDVAINQQSVANETVFPCDISRGFRGLFHTLYLTWAAQAGLSVDFVIFRSKRKPWMSG